MMKAMELQIKAIPTFPRRMSFWKAWNDGKGIMTKEQRALFPPSVTRSGKPKECVLKASRAWGRVDPDGLFVTVTVTVTVTPSAKDSRMGRCSTGTSIGH
jgi:DNA (cytosine-5)-methyltransferase 1